MSASSGADDSVVVPDRMVHDLEVPLALAGLQIDADEALGEQVVAGPMAAVEIGGRRFRPAGRRARASSSTVICVHTPVLPLTAHESFSQVSLPNSPGRGIVLNVQSSLPVRTSKARTSPLVLLCVVTVMPSLNDEPTMTTSLTTVGVACRPISPVSRSIGCRLPIDHADLQIDDAVFAEAGITAPVFAFSATSR